MEDAYFDGVKYVCPDCCEEWDCDAIPDDDDDDWD